MYVDTHVHLNNDKLYNNLDHYIEKALDKGVNTMIVIGYDHKTNTRAIEIASRYPFIFASVGFHPTDAKNIRPEDFDILKQQLKHEKVVGIGECGLDFYWDKDHEAKQIDVFKRQILLSKEMDLPLIIHMRDATEKTFNTLEQYAPLKGIMHCYSGSSEMVDKFISLGLHISLGGPVTFKNAKVPKAVARRVPLDKLLIETDAPYLAPHPYRGKQNDSSFLPLIAESIAELKTETIEDIAAITTRNALSLFNIKEEVK